MNSRERVISSFERTGYDRVPVKHHATPEINKTMMEHFGLTNMEQLLRVVGDDFRYVEPVYCGPELQKDEDGMEGYFGEIYKYAEFEGGKYLEASYLPYAGINDPENLDRSHFPKADWFDYSTIKEQCRHLDGEFAICCGAPSNMDFINGISRARGMEQVLMDLIDSNPVFLEIMEARFEFYYNMHERILQAADGMIDFAHVGEDLGNQLGPMIGMDLFEDYFAPKYEKLFDMIHSYGARTMMHMCGCVFDFLPRLIEIGLDVYDVVQPTNEKMDIANLKRHFGDRLTFCGSVCVQSTLARGSRSEVRKQVKRRLDLFPEGGLFLGPTHATQVGSPLENILEMYRAASSLTETVDESITSIRDDGANDEINMAKLF